MGFFASSGILNRRGFFFPPTAAATPAFSPTDIAGLIVWVKADTGISQSGGVVTSWADQSGQGNDFASSAGAEPTLISSEINSLPAVDFAGDKYMTASVNYTFTGQTFLIVFKYSSNASTYGRLFSQWDENNTNDFELADSYLPFLRFQGQDEIATYANAWFFAESVSDGNAYLAISKHNGSTFTLQINNGSEVADSSTLNAAIATFAISASNAYFLGNDTFNSKVAEILVYSRALNSQELDNLKTYLNGRYAIY